LLKIEKSPGLAPLKVRLLIVIAVAFPLVNVTTFCPPLLPIATAAHVTVGGETVAAAAYLTPQNAHSAIGTIPTGCNFPGARPRPIAENRREMIFTTAVSRTAETRFSANRICLAPETTSVSLDQRRRTPQTSPSSFRRDSEIASLCNRLGLLKSSRSLRNSICAMSG
jgi:hypothetical protein